MIRYGLKTYILLVTHLPSSIVLKVMHWRFPIRLVVHWDVIQQMYEVNGFRYFTETLNFLVMFDVIIVLVFDILHITM